MSEPIYHGVTAGISIGSTTAVFASTSPNGWYYDNGLPDYVSGMTARVRLGTSAGVYTITSATSAEFSAPPFTTYYPATSISATGLTANTPYYYLLQVSYNGGGSWSDAANGESTFTTAPSPPAGPTAAFTVTPVSGTAPLTVQFTDQATGTPAAWSWNFGDGQTLGLQNPYHAYYTAGTYTVTQTVTNAGGTDSEVKNSVLTVLSGAPVAAFTASPLSGTRPLSVTFTDQATNTPTNWGWAIPSIILGEPTFTFIYPNAGTYTVTHTATNALGSSVITSTNLITVKPISVGATFTGGPLSGPPPLSVQFTGTPSGDSTGVLWNFGDGSTTTVLNPSHAYTSIAAFTPTYTVYGTTAGGGAVTSVSTVSRASMITVANDATYKVILEELRKQLLMNTDVGTVCTDFLEWGGTNTILRYIYNRVCRIQLEAGPLRKTSTTISATAPGVLTLPADLIEIRSIYVNGVRLEKTDARMGDVSDQDWQNSPAGDYKGWFTNPGDHLTLNLVPAITPSTFEVYYVYAPTEPTVPGSCTGWETFPVPYVYWWIVKYGVLADMLNHEGEMYDIQRATLCEQMFAEGIELIKLSLEGK